MYFADQQKAYPQLCSGLLRTRKATLPFMLNNKEISESRQAHILLCNTDNYLYLVCLMQPFSITTTVYRALFVVAALAIIDLIAVANAEALLGAVPPDGVLNEPRERPGKPPVELSGLDLLGDRLDDVGAAARPVAGDAVRVVGPEPVQDPGPVQKVVHQGVDGDHAGANLEPAPPTA